MTVINTKAYCSILRKLRKIAWGVRQIRYIAYVQMHEIQNKFAMYLPPPPPFNPIYPSSSLQIHDGRRSNKF